MKKNLLLYILLFFLIIVNGFFLFNYLGKPDLKNDFKQNNPLDFVIKQLNFDKEQLEQLKKVNKVHRLKMMHINDETRRLKDILFSRLSDETINKNVLDSITSLIGNKEKEKDTEAFCHFRSIQELCNEKQKETFKKIINDAIRKGGGDNRPVRDGMDKNGSPPNNGDFNRPPPPPRP